MKITSGFYKNFPLDSPNNANSHPMGSREKIALFNMLTPYLKNATVLDAFAGSGALGLEALSRGVSSVTFVEKSPAIAKTLRNNCKRLLSSLSKSIEPNKPYEDLIKIVISSVENFTTNKTYDLIFADPPYDLFIASPTPQKKHPEITANNQNTNFSSTNPKITTNSQNIKPSPINLSQILTALANFLAPAGILALSNPKSIPLPEPQELKLLKTHTYAAARLSIFQKIC